MIQSSGLKKKKTIILLNYEQSNLQETDFFQKKI